MNKKKRFVNICSIVFELAEILYVKIEQFGLRIVFKDKTSYDVNIFRESVLNQHKKEIEYLLDYLNIDYDIAFESRDLTDYDGVYYEDNNNY